MRTTQTRYKLPGDGECLKARGVVTVGEVLAVILLTWLLGVAFGLALELDARQCAEFERATGTRDAEVAR